MMNPTDTTSLHSLDFGNVYTADGREHPVTAFSLPYLTTNFTQPSSSNPVDPPTTYPATGPNDPTTTATVTNASLSWPDVLTPSFLKDKHIGARFVVGIIGLVILAIVVWRLLK